MSRTYRKCLVAFCNNCELPRYKRTIKHGEQTCECRDLSPNFLYYYGSYLKEVKVRDKKPWYKPPHWFKQMRQQRFRAQEKQALHNHVYKGKDFLPPVNKNSDQWNWM